VTRALWLAGLSALAAVLAGCGAAAPDEEQLVRDVSRGVLEVRDSDDPYGTGFVIDKERGFVLTEAHVIAGLDQLKLRYGNQLVNAELHGEDPCNDLALLRVRHLPSETRALPFGDSSSAKAGQRITVLGFPDTLQDKPKDQKLVATSGQLTIDGTIEVGSDGSTPTSASVIQHQAPTAGGNSGSPIVDDEGRVIGMHEFHNTDVPNQGYGIASNYIKRLLPRLEQGDFVAYIGIFVEPPGSRTRDEVADMDWKIKTPRRGVAVYSVDVDSPAEEHGFSYGDYIHDINGHVIESMDDLCKVLRANEGKKIEIAGKEVDTGQPYLEPVRVR
jgi:S1-C subfamily serine protease